jgi:hypothetical protein
MRNPPKRLRGMPELADKCPPHALGIGETGLPGDYINRVPAFFNQ